jgi:hypothetical protein
MKYNAKIPIHHIGGPGDDHNLISPNDGNGIGTGNFSQPVCVTDYERGFTRPVVLNFFYASVPESVEYDIYVAQFNTDPNASPSQWTKIGSTTNTAGDQVTLVRSGAGSQQFEFVCVKEVTSPSVATTVSAHM